MYQPRPWHSEMCLGTAVPVARDGTDEGEDEGSVDKHCKSVIGFGGQVTARLKEDGISHDHHGLMTYG